MGENSIPKSEDRDDLWKQLQNAVNFRIGEDQIKWSVFSLFSAANTVLVLALLSNDPLSRLGVSFFVCVVGFVLDFVWLGIEYRALQYMRFFESAQRNLEDKLGIDRKLSLTGMRSSVKDELLGRGKKFSGPLMIGLILFAISSWLVGGAFFALSFGCTCFVQG